MIGIYKITNLINNKSYIGQSINIKRRWREHKRMTGKNLMYEDMKKFKIENFSFEVIEECLIDKLDEREIYWIKYYDTYNNGYNLTTGGQLLKNIKKTSNSQLRMTRKTWAVYYYLLFLASKEFLGDSINIFKENLNITQSVTLLKMSRQTFYNSLKVLRGKGLLDKDEEQLLIYPLNINQKVAKQLCLNLLLYNNELSVDLLRLYLYLKENCGKKEIQLTTRKIVQMLDHSSTTVENYQQAKQYLKNLLDYNLIDYEIETKEDNKGNYNIYKILNVK